MQDKAIKCNWRSEIGGLSDLQENKLRRGIGAMKT